MVTYTYGRDHKTTTLTDIINRINPLAQQFGFRATSPGCWTDDKTTVVLKYVQTPKGKKKAVLALKIKGAVTYNFNGSPTTNSIERVLMGQHETLYNNAIIAFVLGVGPFITEAVIKAVNT